MNNFFRLIKRKFPLLWFFAEKINGFLVKIFLHYSIKKMNTVISAECFDKSEDIKNRKLLVSDIDKLHHFLSNLDEKDTTYFKPFSFSKNSLKHILQNAGYISHGFFVNGEIKAFFFLRLYINRKAFLGFLIDKDLRGKGLGSQIIKLFITACNAGNISLYSTVSDENIPSWKSHINNGFKIVNQVDSHNFLLCAD